MRRGLNPWGIDSSRPLVRTIGAPAPGESLLVWTTTPWTLTSNVAAAVNPELTYLAVRLKGEIYYLAKGALKADRMAGGEGDDEGEGDAKGKGKSAWLPGVPRLKTLEQLRPSSVARRQFGRLPIAPDLPDVLYHAASWGWRAGGWRASCP